MKKGVVLVLILTMVCVFGGPAVASLTDGLVAYYPFNGNANDESGNGYDGTLFGNAGVNEVLSIGDNDIDYLSLPNKVLDGLEDFAIGAKVRIKSLRTSGDDPDHFFISGASYKNSNSFFIAYTSQFVDNMSWNVCVPKNYVFTDTSIEDKDWHHLVFLRQGSSLKLYLNGSLVDVHSTDTNRIEIEPKGLIVGNDQDCLGGCLEAEQSWNGDIDDLRIYNRALSESEIQELYQMGMGSPLTVEPTSLDISVGATKSVTIAGGTSPYAATSTDPSVATAVVSGSKLTVTGVTNGAATITVTDSNGNSVDLALTVSDPSGGSISLISPQDKKSVSYGSVNGQVSFSFSAMIGVDTYLLNLTLYDMLADYSVPLQVLLVPGTPGFSISALNIATFQILLDPVSWDALALYEMSWNIQALSDATDLSSVIGTSNKWRFKLQPSGSVPLLAPTDGTTLSKGTDSAPQFQWDLYQGASSYDLILAHVGQVGFDKVLDYPGQSLNIFPLDDTAWQTMTTGTWYWTVLGQDATGAVITPNFTIWSFEVTDVPGVTVSVTPDTVDLTAGQKGSATVAGGTLPYSATSSDPSVATVSITGSTLTVTGVSTGSATITITDSASGSATLIVTVTGKALSVTPDTLDLTVGKKGTATVSGGTLPYKVTSNNPSVATVSIIGSTLSVTGVSCGTVMIVVTDSASASKTVSVTVTGGGTGPSTYSNSLGQTFVLIPAGTFTMGSPVDEPGKYDLEGPQHQVTLTQAFYMQTTEVTQAQWEAVMGSNPSVFKGCPTCPVEWVSWNDVQTFITKLNAMGEGTYSLPTEAQWEYAARAGSTTAFYNGPITAPLGDDPNLDAIGWYWDNSGNQTHPVGQKTPNAWGLYDMSGNVWERCQDWYGSYPSSAVTDPTGPSTGASRVIRGGSWANYAGGCRSANRNNSSPDYAANHIGLRLLRQP